MTQVNTDNQTASSLDFSSPTRRKRDDIVMEVDKVNTVTNDEQLREKLQDFYEYTYMQAVHDGKNSGKTLTEAPTIDEIMQLITADREKIAEEQHRIGMKNGRFGYVHKSELAKAVLDGQIAELERLKQEYHDNIVSDDRMDIEIDERITELQTKRKALE